MTRAKKMMSEEYIFSDILRSRNIRIGNHGPTLHGIFLNIKLRGWRDSNMYSTTPSLVDIHAFT